LGSEAGSARGADEPRARFEALFGAAPEFEVRAPGRVNLIGEHVDYNDLPVLPMALQCATRVLGRPRSDARVRLMNLDARFAPREFELGATIEPSAQGDWSNYAKAAAQLLACEEHVSTGVDLLVHGDIPPAAGLSSSSALVVATGLALAHASDLVFEPLRFADSMARAERYVGTNSGGMDQAICLAGRAGHAVLVEFAPLRAEPIPCPPAWRFLVAHSLVEADKSGAARQHYNSRRADCDLALASLLRSPELDEAPRTYRGLLERFGAERLTWIAQRTLGERPLARFRHQTSEFARVQRACKSLQTGDAEGFGAAMDASHESLRDDFEVSCPQLDALVEAARSSGALGARLTGAGFGGCIVALALERDVERVRAGLQRRFYANQAPPSFDPILAALASDGARIAKL
jgi:galactokinase